MQKFAQFFIGLFKYHKLKFIVAFISILVFAVLLFPYDDLGDVVATKISEATQGQVFCQFDKLGLALFPQPSLELANVDLQTPLVSSLKADQLKLSVSVAALLAFKIGFVVDAKGLFNGRADLSFREGEKIKNGRKYLINFNAQKLDLADIKKTLDLPMNLRGSLNAAVSSNVDPSFTDQPEGDIQIGVNTLEMPASSVATPFGPMNLPSLKWSNVNLKGRLIGGKFIIEDGKLGSSQDPLSGVVHGQMDFRVVKTGAQAAPEFGAYDLRLQLDVSQSVQKDFDLFLSFIDTFRSATPGGSRYLFRATGSRMGVPPRFSPLTSIN